MNLTDDFKKRLADEIRVRLMLETDPISDADLLARTEGSFTYQASICSLRMDDAGQAFAAAIEECAESFRRFARAVHLVKPD